jgi:hypothetical protein
MARNKEIKSISINLPVNYTARPYQMGIVDAIVYKGMKRAVTVWHRRAGKDKTFINILTAMMSKRKGVYYYFLPTYNQGKKIIWDGMDKSGFKFLNHIPEEMILRKNDSEMKIELITGSIFQVVGTDNIDSIMGTNPVGCVFSEYSLQNPQAWEFIRPILLENEGWAIFNFTPRGNNHAKVLYDMARINPNWFCELLTIDDTKDEDGKRYITDEMIEEERVSGMSDSLIQQEYYCKFVDAERNMLIPWENIKNAMYRNIEYEHGMRIAGLDCARRGKDNNTLVVRMGNMVTHIEGWSTSGIENPTMFSSSLVLDRFNQKIFDVLCVDSIGYGGGVADYLRDKGRFPVYDVNVAESSSESQRFGRLRDEAWWKVREWFEGNKCSIPNIKNREKLIDDLKNMSYDFVKGSEKIKVISKADYDVLYSSSPDYGDGFMHTLAIPVDDALTSVNNYKTRNQHYTDNFYNPFQEARHG